MGDEGVGGVDKRGGGSSGSKRSHNTASTRKINTYFFKKPKVEVEAGTLKTGSGEIKSSQAEVNVVLDNASSDQSRSQTLTTSLLSSTDLSLKPDLASDIENTIPANTNTHESSDAIDIASSDLNTSKPSLSSTGLSLNSEFASDIGNYIAANKTTELPDETKALLLEKHWVPPPNYDFPHQLVQKQGKTYKKHVQKSHLDKFHWLVFSHKDQGLYCKYCALLATDFGKLNPGRLVKEPLKAFNNLLGESGLLLQHQRTNYHKKAVECGKNFLEYYHKPKVNIANQISTQRMAQVAENRERLTPIIKTIILCGRQNIPFRGHRDHGHILSDCSDVSFSEGNFRALLKFRIDAGDSVLERHLSSRSAATYISKSIQNELIDICKEQIQKHIIQNVKKAKFFSVMFDETTDISHTEQMSLSFRYFNDGVIKEDFICFCDAYEMLQCVERDSLDGTKELRLTGIALAKIVESLCYKFDLDLAFCVGIGTDSCSVMASDVKGAVQELSKKAIHAKRCPCNNHALNNSLAKSSNVTSCRNTTGTMKKIVAFAKASAKRHRVFSQELGDMAIQSLSETRWVERHDGHLQYQGDNLFKICNALEKISTWQDNKTSSDAHCLLQTVRSSDFIITSICLSDILGTTVSLSPFLQTASIDMKRATDAIKDVLEVLQSKRQNAEVVFSQLFSEASEQAKQLDITLKAPRTVPRQINRCNIQTKSAEEYFRIATYIPLLDSVINDLGQRLSPEVLDLFQLGVFLPKSNFTVTDCNIEAVKNLVRLYRKFINDHESTVVNEYRLWMAKWKRENENSSAIPETVVHLIEACDKDLYPNVKIFLQILATLPVSVATAERSFSTLRRVKTWLRATIAQERLSGLALLHIHKDIEIDIDDIINVFARKKRKLDFVI